MIIFEALATQVYKSERQHEPGWGVTLTLPGQVITGFMIPAWQWFEMFKEEAAWPKEAADQVDILVDRSKTLSKNYHDALRLSPLEWTKDQKEAFEKEAEQVYLSQARYIMGGSPPIPTNRGVLWSGRIRDVIGFSFGVMGDTPPGD